MNDDLLNMSKNELMAEVVKLRTAIRTHRNYKGHNRCWLDDGDLYQVLPELEKADFKLPEKPEFLHNCEQYWHERQPQNE